MQNTVSMPTKTKWKSSFAMLVARPNFHFQVLSFFFFSFAIQKQRKNLNPSVSKMAHNDWAHLV